MNKASITIATLTTIGVAVIGWMFWGIGRASDKADASIEYSNEAKIQTAGLIEKVEAIKENVDGLKTEVKEFKKDIGDKMEIQNNKLNILLSR